MNTITAARIRLNRNKRGSNPPGIALNERDAKVIRGVEKYRYLATRQIKDLFFQDCSVQVCRLRLLKLYQNGYLNRLRVETGNGNGSAEAVYCLDKKGWRVLAAERDEDFSPKVHYAQVGGIFLRHTLDIIAFRLALEKEVALRQDVSIFVWFSEHDVADPAAAKKKDRFFIYDEIIDPENKGKRITVYPDAAFVLEVSGRNQLYFLEIDRGTMPHNRIREKVRGYYLYRKTNRFKYRYGQEYEGFKVVFQTVSQERIKNLLESLRGEKGLELFLFAEVRGVANSGILSQLI